MIINQFQISGFSPSTVGGTGTAAKYFPAPSNQIGVAGTTPSAASAAGQLSVPGSNRLNGQQFKIYMSGNFEVGAGGACPNVTVDLVANTGTIAVPVYTVLGTTGALHVQNLTGVLYPFSIKAEVSGDSGSGLLQGIYQAIADGVIENSTPKALDNILSGLNFASEPPFGLLARVTFSVSETGNLANLFQFQISCD